MKLFCIEEFKTQYEKCIKNKSYKDLPKELSDYFREKTTEQLKSGTLLNRSSKYPYIKKRIAGSGGYRIYYLIVILGDKIILGFVHPKTGKFGVDNIDDIEEDYKKTTYQKIVEALESEDQMLYKIELSDSKPYLVIDI